MVQVVRPQSDSILRLRPQPCLFPSLGSNAAVKGQMHHALYRGRICFCGLLPQYQLTKPLAGGLREGALWNLAKEKHCPAAQRKPRGQTVCHYPFG